MNTQDNTGKFVAPRRARERRFDELKVGDKVGVSYNNNVMVRLKPTGEAAWSIAPTRPPPWERKRAAWGTVSTMRLTTATIADVDGQHVVDDFCRAER